MTDPSAPYDEDAPEIRRYAIDRMFDYDWSQRSVTAAGVVGHEQDVLQLIAASEPAQSGPPPAYEPPTTSVTPILSATVTLDDLVLIERAWRREVKNVILPELERTMRAAADRVLTDIATEAPVLWDVSQPQAQAFLTQTQNQLVGVGEDMWKRTRDELIVGMQEGESIQQLSTRVKEVLSTTDARARTIARTEVIGASNAGAMQQLELLGPDAPARKTWVSTHDARTRLSHRAADGQTVDFVAPFTVGGAKFDYPGDPDAPAGERVNCRCTLVWHFEDLPLKSTLQASSPLELFTKAGDPYHRDNHGRFAPKGGGGGSAGAVEGGGSKQTLKPSHVTHAHYNADEHAELASIEADHKAGKISDKEYKYKTYYVKVKASKRINKSGGVGAGASAKVEPKKIEPKVEPKTVGGFKEGDVVQLPSGKQGVVAGRIEKTNSLIVDTPEGDSFVIHKDHLKKPGATGPKPEHAFKKGDTVTVPSGKEGVVTDVAGNHVGVKVKDGDEFYFHKDKLVSGHTPKTETPSVAHKPATPTPLKPSQVMNHHLNADEQKELADLNDKFNKGEINGTEFKSKSYYVKVKASKRINKESGATGMPKGGASTKVPGMGSSPTGGVHSALPKEIRQENSSTRTMAIKNGEILRKKTRMSIEGAHGGSIIQSHNVYTGSGYKPINHFARTGQKHPHYDMSTTTSARHIKNIDKSFDVHGVTTTQPILVARGVRGDYAQQLKSLKVGDVITERGFMSTSTKTTAPHGFKSSNGVMMEIGVPPGKRMVAGTAYEHELLFPRNAQLKVVGKSPNGAIQFDML